MVGDTARLCHISPASKASKSNMNDVSMTLVESLIVSLLRPVRTPLMMSVPLPPFSVSLPASPSNVSMP